MPAGQTYDSIATSTVSGTSTSTVTFSGISGAYTDLIFVAELRTSTNTTTRLRFNSNSTGNYNNMAALSASQDAWTTSNSALDNQLNLVPGTTTNRTLIIGHILNYAQTNTKTSVFMQVAQTDANIGARLGSFNNTSGITAIEFSVAAGYIEPTSTFTLYGITAA